MNENPFNFFDNILKILSNNYNKKFSLQELTIIVHPATDKDYATKIIQQRNNEDDVLNALMFLNSEGLVALDIENRRTIINTKGLIKIRTKGFEDEFLENEKSRKAQIFSQKATPYIAMIALIVSVINLIFIIFFKK